MRHDRSRSQLATGKESTARTVRRQGRAGLEVEVGFNLGVQRCSGFRYFSAELASLWPRTHEVVNEFRHERLM